jgi:hypothetical protein
MNTGGKVVIIKEGQAPPPTSKSVAPPQKGRATVKRPLKGILKVKGVADPAKSPPLRKTAKRRRIQILTDSGSKKYRKTIRRKLDKMSNKQVKDLAEKHGLVKGKNTPPELMRHIVEGGITAGFVSEP